MTSVSLTTSEKTRSATMTDAAISPQLLPHESGDLSNFQVFEKSVESHREMVDRSITVPDASVARNRIDIPRESRTEQARHNPIKRRSALAMNRTGSVNSNALPATVATLTGLTAVAMFSTGDILLGGINLALCAGSLVIAKAQGRW